MNRHVGREEPFALAASDGSSALIQTAEYHEASKAEIAGPLGRVPQPLTGRVKAAGLKYVAAFTGSVATSCAATRSEIIATDERHYPGLSTYAFHGPGRASI